jgi:hypothetical protein
VSEDARQMLRELLAEALAGANGNGVVPQVPAPPVAAVHRPSSWQAPDAAEQVVIRNDDDLNRFVRDVLARPDREAILAGRVRFTLAAAAGGAAPAGAPPAGTLRVERGAVTERKVDEAARQGARLVLGRGAVLTPLAREKARAKGIAIEREHS